MQEVSNVSHIREPVVVTLGNFDGVHLGHQKLLRHLRVLSIRYCAKPCVMTFVPHPKAVLSPKKEGFLINSYDERKQLIADLGIAYYIPLVFDRELSIKKPDDFLREYLEPCHLRAILLGYDFSFGVGKEGGHGVVQNYFARKDVYIVTQDKISWNQKGVSSTRVRELISEGDFSTVTALLGRNFFISGRVERGYGRGAKIKFPTINISLNEERVCPKLGVYISRTVHNDIAYQSVTNIGINPTFELLKTVSMETNIFDFNGQLYGENVQIELLRRIRDEKKFATSGELSLQIAKDIDCAKKFFSI